VIIATMATIIASQALITGIFTVTWQAIMLNYLPRMQVKHTSDRQFGQVYVPAINWVLFILVASAILIFKTSENLATAYGFSVSGIMLLTTILTLMFASIEWQWAKWKLYSVFSLFLLLDVIFLSANGIKIFEGAWYALLITALVYYVVYVWQAGNKALNSQKHIMDMDAEDYLIDYEKKYKSRIPGAAIFMTRVPYHIPHAFALHLAHNKFLHEQVIFISVLTENKPRVHSSNRYTLEKIRPSVFQITARYGYKEIPDLHKVIKWAQEHDHTIEKNDLTYFLSKGVPVISKKYLMGAVNEYVYLFLARLSMNASDFYRIPHTKVIELGVRYQI
jgi:KUP system potassium uptake protein